MAASCCATSLISIDRSSWVAVQGPSGSGKTTLFRVLAGIWPFGRGRITLPGEARVLFLPQRPYLPARHAAEAAATRKPDAHPQQAFEDALSACRLAPLRNRLDESGNWTMTLSIGEQQRMAFAVPCSTGRTSCSSMKATSALDEATEAELYRLLRERLPEAAIISIAHKPAVVRLHDHLIAVSPQGECRQLQPANP
ncbi:MAG: ATP-binding cassette domain-containing protein [Rhodospirillales bacterium]